MSAATDQPKLTRGEVAALAGVGLGVLDKAIEQKVLRVSRARGRTWLSTHDVGLVALLARTAIPLPVEVKRAIRRWVSDAAPFRSNRIAELEINETLVVRWPRELTSAVKAAESYARLRDRWIHTDPGIKGGEPVIRGTRIGVRGIAQRIDAGDSIATLTEDYPHVPAAAFQAAYTYAKAHPRRGRPVRPWRQADEGLDRRGSHAGARRRRAPARA